MAGNQFENWSEYSVGMERNGLSFTEKPWDLESSQYVGMQVKDFIPIALRESRFCPGGFAPTRSNRVHGGIIQANFIYFRVKPLEAPGEIQIARNIFVPVGIGPDGLMETNNPLERNLPPIDEYGLAIGSRVALNNLDIPGGVIDWAHFPMLDIIKPPTSENIAYVIDQIRKRTGLERFFIIRTSEHGMFMFSPELVDEARWLDICNKAAKMNHYEKDHDDVWIDERWLRWNQGNFHDELGVNTQQVCGIMRIDAVPPYKPEIPIIVAASF